MSKFICFIFALIISINLYATPHQINLSMPPENRWTDIVNQYDKEDLRRYAAMIDKMMVDESFILGFSWVRQAIMSYGWYGSMETDPAWFGDLRAEIKGLSEALKNRMGGESLKGFNEEDLFLMNVGYDFSTYCTTGVYQSPKGPILFRNLDWEGNEFRKFAIEAEFIKDDQTVFRSYHFLGQVGVFTGMKPESFAVALNYRKTPGTGTFGWEVIHNISQFVFKDGWSSPILLRFTLEHDQDFSSARDRLERTELIAPSYLILAGIHQDEGAVIERGRDSKHTRNFSDPFENAKFLVQTNHDIPKPAGQDENWAGDDLLLNESMGMGTVSRREAAVAFLESIDENNLDSELMEMLVNHWPVFNSWTIFSSLLSPANNEMNWIVQEPNK